MAERAGFEPAKNEHKHLETGAFGHNGPQIGPQGPGTSEHHETRPVTCAASRDLEKLIDAWPFLSDELRFAVLAIVRIS
jgi:hypothetical protein